MCSLTISDDDDDDDDDDGGGGGGHNGGQDDDEYDEGDDLCAGRRDDVKMNRIITWMKHKLCII